MQRDPRVNPRAPSDSWIAARSGAAFSWPKIGTLAVSYRAGDMYAPNLDRYEALQALTFYASRDKLATVGLDNKLEDLNRAAVRTRCIPAPVLKLSGPHSGGNT